ncbi:S8 family serine peptidase [Bacillus sp. 165]|uniref:S8 family serine peptidase n=1 Tax=Bacillus sp. 165 TaxID=1529117 RepID=UPI001ADC9022|nr:S8 family serine peptidase [Bacillus sp. 165]MBO9130822.1 S8 family serine peptidase [Bacillus sp. 165]
MSKNKKILVLTLGAGLVLSSANVPAVNVLAEKPTSLESVLSNLTPQQRENYKQLQAVETEGLYLSSTVDLESNETIKVIVQLDHHPEKVAQLKAQLEGKALSSDQAKKNIEDDQTAFKNHVAKMFKGKSNGAYKIKKTYTRTLNGFSMELPANKVQELLDLKVVRAIWSDATVQVEPPVQEKNETQTDAKPLIVDSLPFLGIDKLHNEGFTGKGIKVGVIDTGIDYHHPDLDGVYKGGYDFVDNDNDPMETTYEDWKKSGKKEISGGNSYYTEHGTHVSGTIAGQGDNSSDYSVMGIAPDADLYAYRVLGPYGSGTTEAVLAGIEQAVTDGMDVINLSLGATVNNPFYPTSVAINNAVLSGVTAVVSAGNSGSNSFTVGSPGTSALALTVGASDVPRNVTTFKGQYGSNSINLQLMAKHYSDKLADFEGMNLPIVDVGLGKSTDYVGKPNVSGKIVLISRGDGALVDKITVAKQRGAKAVLLYNNNEAEGQIPYYFGEGMDFIPTFSLTKQEGEALQSSLQSTENLTFHDMGQVTMEGDRLAGFSSRGPSRVNYDIKPEIVAPGVSVISTVPSYINDKTNGTYDYAYARLSGTSMASPHVAGIAALLLQSNKNYKPADIKSILMNTADPLNGDYSVYEVGAGRVDPYEAIHSHMNFQVVDETQNIEDGKEVTIADRTGAMSFGLRYIDDKDLRDKRTIEITNTGDTNKTFQASVKFTKRSLNGQENGVSLSFDKQLTVKAGKSMKTNISLNIPQTAEKGYYEGYVKYVNTADSSEEYQIPFAVRVTEEGIEDIEAFNFSTKINNQFGSVFNFTPGSFVLRSPMEQLSLVLVDPKTNKDLGLVGTLDPTLIGEGIRVVLYSMFSGYYYPYTENAKNPISVNPTLAPEGHYKLKLVGVNAKGKTFTAETDTFIDNTAPEISSSLPTGVYEYEPGTTTVPVSMKLYDKGIDDMKAAGLNVTQSNNYITYYWGSPYPNPIPLITDANGDFSDEILMGASLNRYPVAFFGFDSVGNFASSGPIINHFLPKGTPYVTASMDKKEVKAGDLIKLTLTANNMEKLKQGNFSVTYDKNEMELVDVQLNPEFLKYGKSTMTKEVIDQQGKPTNQLNTTVVISEGSGVEVTGHVPVIDVIVKAKEAKFGKRNALKTPSPSATYIDTDGKVTNVKGYFAGDNPELLRSYSEVRGSILAQGFYGADGKYDYDIDFSNAPISVKVTDADGKKYDGTMQRNDFTVTGLPVTDRPFEMEVNIPGHFPVHTSFTLYEQRGDRVIGTWREMLLRKQDAGDVNQDSVIDILDAVAIKESWGSNNQEADLNFDGVIDAKDFELVEYNYLETDPGVNDAPHPKRTYKGQTLGDIKKELGIN